MTTCLRTAGKTRAESILAKPLELEEALAAVDALEVLREHQGQDGHELHEDVERRARRVLEGVADRVADDAGIVVGLLARVLERAARATAVSTA